MPLRSVTLDDLTIDDASSFRHVGIYGRLEDKLRVSGHRFLIPDGDTATSWDRAVFLNLTYWNSPDAADVLCDDHIPADVVAHVALHHVVARELSLAGASVKPSVASLLFAESIASAFDVYLVGRLVRHAPGSDFIESQVPIMSDAAQEAGATEDEFAALIDTIADNPERAFEDLRALLFDVASALFAAADARSAHVLLERVADHRFAPLLHHFQLSNWILYARAFGDPTPDDAVRTLDCTLREAPVSLDWIDTQWLE